MKICSQCNAANGDSAKFCSECGLSLTAEAPAKPVSTPVEPVPTPAAPVSTPVEAAPTLATPASPQGTRLDVAQMAQDLSAPPSAPLSGRLNVEALSAAMSHSARQLEGPRKADIMFVLDCTASMKAELSVMKSAILSFTDTIAGEGVETRIGLIAFRDRHPQNGHPGEEAMVMDFGGTSFTNDPAQFRRAVEPLTAEGGGDIPESSLDAILLALRQPFAPDATKIIVLITDAPPKVPDVEAQSVAEVSAAIQQAGVRQIYLVIRVQEAVNNIYLKLLERTNGLAFDLGYGDDFGPRAETFKRTLLELGKTISKVTR